MLGILTVICMCFTLLSAEATLKPNATIVRWETDHEFNVLGFNLYRDGVKLNESIIPATYIGQSRGAEYKYRDENMPCGKHQYTVAVVSPLLAEIETQDTDKVRLPCNKKK